MSAQSGGGEQIVALGAFMSLKPSAVATASPCLNLTSFYVKGDVLHELPVSPPFYPLGFQTEIAQNSVDVGSISLHSQALLGAFLLNDAFRAITFKLPELLKMVFDEALYARYPSDKVNPQRNFLEHLIRHEVGVGATATTAAIGDDWMMGGSEADLLLGNEGDDHMGGGRGNDSLIGGAGFDTYLINAGDGHDTILDSDGQGQIKLGGLVAQGSATAGLDPAKWRQSGNVWQDQQNGITYGLVTLTDGSQTLFITGLAGSTVEIKGWSAGELGIALGAGAQQSAVTAPASNLTIVGDLKLLDTDPGTDGVQAGYDALYNLLVTNEADPNRADILYDSAGNDLLQGLGGNDTLIAWRGGDDVLEGGSGQDYLSGGTGNDTLVGGDDSDVLLGGEGEDLLIGGGGNDNIYGDQHGDASIDWTLTRTIADENSKTVYRSDITHGTQVAAAVGAADVIYGGAGDDWIKGGPGNDFIDAGADNDVVFGDEGSDVILGGTGNDVLIGNAGFDRPENDGGDYIDGGAGNDQIWGGGGNDMLLGGDGDDVIYGDGNGTLPEDEGDDYIDGGSGNDRLFGGGGNDSLLGGDGDDFLYGEAGNDTLDGGEGADYLKDRAAMLSWKLKFGTNDTQPVGDTFVQPQSGTPFYFEDFTSNAITTKMRIGGGDSVNAVMSRPLGDFKLVVFGSDNHDVLTGQGRADRLYGGVANEAVWKEAA